MPYVLRPLMLESSLDTLRVDDFYLGVAGRIVRKSASVGRRTAAWVARLAASASGAESVTTAPVATGDDRPMALGVAVPLVPRLANRTRHRQTGDCHRLASSGLPPV